MLAGYQAPARQIQVEISLPTAQLCVAFAWDTKCLGSAGRAGALCLPTGRSLAQENTRRAPRFSADRPGQLGWHGWVVEV